MERHKIRKTPTINSAIITTLVAVTLVFALMMLLLLNFLFSRSIDHEKNMDIEDATHISVSLKDSFDYMSRLLSLTWDSLIVNNLQQGQGISGGSYDQVLSTILELNPDIHCAWFIFEKGAYYEEEYYAKEYFRQNGVISEGFSLNIDEIMANPDSALWYFEPLTTGETYFTGAEPYKYSVGGELVYAATISMPILVDGEIVGVIGIDMLYEDILELIYDIHIKQNRIIMLLSQDMTILHASDNELINKNLADFPFENIDQMRAAMTQGIVYSEETISPIINEKIFTYLQPILVGIGSDQQTLYLRISTPISDLNAEAYSIAFFIIIASCACVLLILGIIFINVNRVVRPVRDLSRQARQVASGDYKVDVFDIHADDIRSNNEIVILRSAFNEMLHALQNNLRTVETQVEERTRELNKLNSYIRMVVDHATNMFVLVDRDMKMLYCSSSVLDLLGIDDYNEIISKPLNSGAHAKFPDQDYAERSKERFARILSGEEVIVTEDEINWPGKGLRSFHITYRRVMDRDGNFDGIVLTMLDVTDVRQVEAEYRVNDMINSTRTPCFVWDETGCIVAYNKESARAFNLPDDISPEEFNELYFSIEPDRQPSGMQTKAVRLNLIREALEKGFAQIDGRLAKSDGSSIYVSVTVARITWMSGYRLIVYHNDTTELVLKEAEAKEAEERIKLIFDATPLCCFLWDETINLIDCNEECVRVFGLPDKQILLDDFSRFSPKRQPDGRISSERAAECIKEAFEKGRSVLDWVHQDYNGEPIPCEVTLVRILNSNGNIVVGYIRDLREHNRMMAETAEANERVKLMLDSAPFSCHYFDRTGKVIDCNQEALNLFKMTDKQKHLDNFYEIMPEYQPNGALSAKAAEELLIEAFNEGRVSFEWVHQSADGELIPSEVTLVRVNYGDSSIVLGYVRDLREYKRAMAETDEANERIRLMLDSNPMICILRDSNGNIIDCNQAALDIFGAADKADLIRDYNKLYPEYQPDGSKSIDKAYSIIHEKVGKEKAISYEWMFRTFSGEPLPVETTFVQIQWEGAYRIISYSRDLREIKAREQETRESAGREREADIQMKAAQAANSAKGQFLAHMSHEIRTPMNSIVGFSELAIEEAMSPKAKEYLNRIIGNSKWLLQIINDILDTSKIESGNMDLENIPFDLRELLADCKSTILPRSIEKNIELYFYAETAARRKLCGDPTRLRQVLLNLLSNAVKFTESGKVSLVIRVISSAEDATTLRFEVNDSGIGMTTEQISKIFEPFVQADTSTTRKYGGTGLGLPITKNILELMGSKLEIESEPGVGTTIGFTVTINTVDGADEMLEIGDEVDELERPLFKGIVLVCEDNKMNQQVITEHLAKVGLTADIAENGQKGIEKVRQRIEKNQKPYDLIFMDIYMPVMDGIEATPKIIGLGSGTPIVAMTADIMIEDRELYKTLGMNDCVGKPFTSQELWRCLLKYLKPVEFMASESEEDEFQNQLNIEFVKSNQDKYSEITRAIDDEDITLAHRLAHNLKSNAGLIGQTRLQKAAEDVENALKYGNNSTTAPQMNLLRNELAEALEKLKPYLQIERNLAQPEPPDSMFDAKEVSEVFEKLEPLLNSGSPESLKLVNCLRGIPGSEELIEQIEDFNFGNAEKTLSELKKRIGI